MDLSIQSRASWLETNPDFWPNRLRDYCLRTNAQRAFRPNAKFGMESGKNTPLARWTWKKRPTHVLNGRQTRKLGFSFLSSSFCVWGCRDSHLLGTQFGIRKFGIFGQLSISNEWKTKIGKKKVPCSRFRLISILTWFYAIVNMSWPKITY